MKTALYIIWFSVPAFFFLMALWSYLESLSGKDLRAGAGDSFKQGIFVLVCVLICVLIDKTVLPDLVADSVGDLVPLGFFEALLLPAVLYLAALVVGPSRNILISKAPKPSQVRKK